MKQITEEIKEKSRLTKEEWREYTKTVWHIANVSNPGHPAVFPLEIPRRLIKLFSFWDELVLDPFAGVGTTGLAAQELGRRALLIDQSARYCEAARMTFGLPKKNGHVTRPVRVVEGDSRKIDLSEGAVDLVVTSPPYWNKADYGKDPKNLGKIDNYGRFLAEISKVFAECFRVLKPGRKMCVVTANVNQHTDHGLVTIPLAADYTRALQDAGFYFVNEVIWSKDRTGGRWGSSGIQRPIFGSYPFPPNFLFKNVHEHVLVVAKPPARKANGPRAIPYASLRESATQNGGT